MRNLKISALDFIDNFIDNPNYYIVDYDSGKVIDENDYDEDDLMNWIVVMISYQPEFKRDYMGPGVYIYVNTDLKKFRY